MKPKKSNINILIFLLVVAISSPLCFAEPVTLSDTYINGTLCYDKTSVLKVFFIDLQNSTVKIDRLKVFIDNKNLNQSFNTNFTIYESINNYYEIVFNPLDNLFENNITSLNITTIAIQQKKEVERKYKIPIQKCRSIEDKINEDYIDKFSDFFMNNSELFIFLTVLIFLIFLVYMIYKIRKR